MPLNALMPHLAVRRVLAVEDSPEDALALEVLLTRLPPPGFDVATVGSLEEARMALSLARPCIVLLDLNLPDGEGPGAILRLREAASGVPIVAMLEEDDEELALEAVRAGAQDYLVKGQVDQRILARTLRHSLERHRLLAELEAARAEAAYRSTHDALTKLPNRALLLDRLRHAVARAERRREKVALIFMDLDGFKTLNDSLGHAAGDAALVEVAHRLASTVRQADTVARLGGDEFVAVVERVPGLAAATSLAETIRARVSVPLSLPGGSRSVGLSFGIALYPDDSRDPEVLLDRADTAMYGMKGAVRRIRALG